jgi:cellulose synthase (UDP-forming)
MQRASARVKQVKIFADIYLQTTGHLEGTATAYPYAGCMSTSPGRPNAGTRLFRILVFCLTLFLLLQLISLYLSWPKQAILGGVSLLLAITANRLSAARIVTLALMIISITATLRYAWWRTHLLVDYFSDQANNRVSIDSVFMLILISAEAYTILIMVLGYMQTMCPLKRMPIRLPDDETQWPHVDRLRPTYNEPLSLVRYTALAANAIDYPPEKLHVYILDDGTRQEFKEFAHQAGVGYVTRLKHNHAKAGNINHALTTMDSPYVAIFDCDHVPTRSFLQMTLGWMIVDPRLAMLQTPHHFYSPDPFQRNLLRYKTIPSEAELFYGIIQDGNDFWNATFFCGSCALIRRSALDEVGGIATETVTEDAHTSLRMQKRGYGTAYINVPQAAGLATETLSAHVGQRIRWARGMIQIFRTDNPLLARGMKLSQRLCYFNAMAHFMYPVPRLVFLGAPLVYMLLGRSIIPGYWVAILAYAVPHLILSSLTNSRIQGRHRHSFWNEIYETVLAPYILAPTLLALINPKLGKFNVTDKGSTLSETHFDGKIAWPTKWMLLINFLGVLVAPYRLFIKDPEHKGTVIANLVWILFNMVILGVAAAVANEQKQRRGSVRIAAKIPVRMDLQDGQRVDGMTMDMSVGGASVKFSGGAHFALGDLLRVAFPKHADDEDIEAKVLGISDGELRLSFSVPTIAEQETLTRALYSRADAWLTPAENIEVDRPFRSLRRVIVLSFMGIYQICKSLFPEKRAVARPRPAPTAALIVVACVLGACAQGLGLPPQTSGKARAVVVTTIFPPVTEETGRRGDDATPAPAEGDHSVVQTLSLKDMGVLQAIDMRGPHSYYSVHFTLSHALLPRHAPLKMIYSFNSGLDPHTTSLKISLNDTTIATFLPPPPSAASDGITETTVLVPTDLLVRSNTLIFEFSGSGVMQQEAQATRILCHINTASTLEVSGDRLRLQNDLDQLPLPFFDRDLQTTTTVLFAFLAPPSAKTLEAAGMIASWLGLLPSSKPVRFAVSVGPMPPGNAILFSNQRSMLPKSLQIPSGAGPLLAIRSNPSDTDESVLVLAGEDDEQLLTVARTLSLTSKATATDPAQGLPLNGDTMPIPDLVMPPARKRDDAPRWLPTVRAAPLANCRTQDALQSDGSSPIPVYFHLPPDLFYGERQNLKLNLYYRYNALQAAAGSMLRVVLNGKLVNEIGLPPGTDLHDGERFILVPVVNMRPFGNTIFFNYDFVAANREATENPASAVLHGEILCNSSLDLQGLALWTRMPNIELFANAGFPLTQLADLSQTTVILPLVPSPDEISLYLLLMSHFGTQTGYPALRVTVAGPNAVIGKAYNYLILGTVANQPAFRSLAASLPVTLDSYGVHVKPAQSYLALLSSLEDVWSRWWPRLLGNPATPSQPSNLGSVPDALIEEIQSPASPDRSFVLITLKQNSSAEAFAGAFLDRSQSRDMSGSVSLLRNAKFESYLIDGNTYHVGDISPFALMRIYLTQYFLLLLLLVTLLSFVLARWVHGWLTLAARERLKLAENGNLAD